MKQKLFLPSIVEVSDILIIYLKGLECDNSDLSLTLAISQIHPAKLEFYYKMQDFS